LHHEFFSDSCPFAGMTEKYLVRAENLSAEISLGNFRAAL
jgi:hypothetical protein